MNGWKNYETFNVALWIQNDESLYCIAKESSSYNGFLIQLNDIIQSGDLDFKVTTPDGVKWNDPKIDVDAIDKIIKDLE